MFHYRIYYIMNSINNVYKTIYILTIFNSSLQVKTDLIL